MYACPHQGSSPLTRGARYIAPTFDVWPGIIPAHAGSTGISFSYSVSGSDHPRSRGEHGGVQIFGPFVPGSSPLTRGAHCGLTRRDHRRRIIPAHAGSTRALGSGGGVPWDHPRSRGEHLLRARQRWWDLGSSPLTRGARGSNDGHRAPAGIIPAHAGSTDVAQRAWSVD